MELKKREQFYWLPTEAKIGVSDTRVSFEELANLVASLSFDRPDALVNYSIEVVPAKKPKRTH